MILGLILAGVAAAGGMVVLLSSDEDQEAVALQWESIEVWRDRWTITVVTFYPTEGFCAKESGGIELDVEGRWRQWLRGWSAPPLGTDWTAPLSAARSRSRHARRTVATRGRTLRARRRVGGWLQVQHVLTSRYRCAAHTRSGRRGPRGRAGDMVRRALTAGAFSASSCSDHLVDPAGSCPKRKLTSADGSFDPRQCVGGRRTIGHGLVVHGGEERVPHSRWEPRYYHARSARCAPSWTTVP